MLIIWIAQCPSRWFYTAVTILAWFTWVRDGGRRSKLDRDLDRIDIDVQYFFMATKKSEPNQIDIIARLVALEVKMDNFTDWQEKQSKELVQLKKDIGLMSKGIEKAQWWLIGILGGVLANLIVYLA